MAKDLISSSMATCTWENITMGPLRVLVSTNGLMGTHTQAPLSMARKKGKESGRSRRVTVTLMKESMLTI